MNKIKSVLFQGYPAYPFYFSMLILAFAFFFLPSTPYIAVYPFILGMFAFAGLIRPDVGVAAIVFMQPSSMIIKYKEPSSIIIAGFRLEIIAVFIFFFSIRHLYLASNKHVARRLRTVKRPLQNNSCRFLLLYVIWAMLVSVLYCESLSHIFLVFREHFAVLVLFPVLLVLLADYKDFDKRLVSAMFYGGLLPALVSLLEYYSILDLFAPVILITGDYIEQRSLSGFTISRFNPLLGPGPAGGGVYYSSLFLVGLIRVLKGVDGRKFLNSLILIIYLFCAILTLSYSILISLFIVITIWIAVAKTRRQQKFNILLLVALLFIVMLNASFLGVQTMRGHEPLSIFTYASRIIRSHSQFVLNHINSTNLFIGSGFDINSAGSDRVLRLKQVTWDLGWFQTFLYTGAIGFCLILFFLKDIFQKFFRLRRFVSTPHNRYIYLASGTMLFSLFGYVHAAAIEVRPMDINFIVAAAIIVFLHSSNHVNAKSSDVLEPQRVCRMQENDMSKFPTISIVTPSLNQAKYLAECMDSIISQNYPRLEYIVIDGGSNDGSQDIIREREQHLSYWCSEKDDGQCDALIKGLDRCTGELFAWVNSDDILLPGCLEAIANCYLNEKQPDIIHSNVAYIDSETSVTRLVRVPRQSRFFFFRGVWHGAAPSIFFKTAHLRLVGGLDKNLHLSMDLDIWMKMIQARAKISHVPEYLGGYRWHDNSKSTIAINSRKTCENSETTQILEEHLNGSTIPKRVFWRKIYKLYQILNLNYLRAAIDLKNNRKVKANGSSNYRKMDGRKI